MYDTTIMYYLELIVLPRDVLMTLLVYIRYMCALTRVYIAP